MRGDDETLEDAKIAGTIVRGGELGVIRYLIPRERHLHKRPKCGQIVKAINLQETNILNWFLWKMGWGKKHWHFMWDCPTCGNHNKTHTMS